MDKIPTTKQGYTALEEELKTLKLEDRPAVIQAIAEARDASTRIMRLLAQMRRFQVFSVSNTLLE